MSGRHYGMDWLRIAAFALLILYHIGMIYVPWDFHVNARAPQDWLHYPMLALNPWRLSLLFLVSGFASRYLLEKLRAPGAFARSRSKRLLLPLLSGIAVLVPIQPWVELVTKHGYADGFWHFWFFEYFAAQQLHGIILPTWNHLWFVAYLLVYTLIFAGCAVLVGQNGERLQSAFDEMFSGARLLIVPIAWLFCVRALLFPHFGETHMLVGDWAAHATYGFAFFFGAGLARSEAVWSAIRQGWLRLALGAAIAGICFLWVEWTQTGQGIATFRSIYAWSAILACVALFDRFANRDHPILVRLSEAVFSFYLIHQSGIILCFWWLGPFALPQMAEFVLLVVMTGLICWLFYRLGHFVPALRPLIGLPQARVQAR